MSLRNERIKECFIGLYERDKKVAMDDLKAALGKALDGQGREDLGHRAYHDDGRDRLLLFHNAGPSGYRRRKLR